MLARYGPEAMREIAIAEWMGASPIYTQRMKNALGFHGNDVATIFKGMQFDVSRARHARARRSAGEGSEPGARAVRPCLGGQVPCACASNPREVCDGLRYVLLNGRKHRVIGRGIDPCSSGAWFGGWQEGGQAPPGAVPVARSRTWLLTVGWRRSGPIGIDDSPAGSGR